MLTTRKENKKREAKYTKYHSERELNTQSNLSVPDLMLCKVCRGGMGLFLGHLVNYRQRFSYSRPTLSLNWATLGPRLQ